MTLPGPVPMRGGAAALARRIIAFAGLPFLSLLAPFIFLPVLARLAGDESWVAIALGQSVGGFAALVASLGYATLAPPRVAVASEQERRRILATSIHTRTPVWLVIAVIAVVVSIAITPDLARTEAALMAVAMSLAALAPTWFWIGVGKVKPILWLEVAPRMLASIGATGILLAGGPVIWYPVLLLLAMLVAPVVVTWRVAGAEVLRVSRPEIKTIAKLHPSGLIAEAAGGAYSALAVTIVTAVTPLGQAARYVSGDKAFRIGQYSVSALGNALQGWVVQAQPGRLAVRLKTAVGLHAALGSIGMVAFGALGPWLTRVLFGDSVAISSGIAWGFGVAFLGISLGTACGRVGLVALGAPKVFMACVVGASALGVAGLVVGGLNWGAAGAAWGMGVTELLSGLAQGIALVLVWRKISATNPPA